MYAVLLAILAFAYLIAQLFSSQIQIATDMSEQKTTKRHNRHASVHHPLASELEQAAAVHALRAAEATQREAEAAEQMRKAELERLAEVEKALELQRLAELAALADLTSPRHDYGSDKRFHHHSRICRH